MTTLPDPVPTCAAADEPVPWTAAWHDLQVRRLGEFACHQLGFYAIPEGFLLTVVVPFFNEEATLQRLVERVAAVPINKEILLIDDGSSDGSGTLANQLATTSFPRTVVRSTRHPRNLGKGAALKTGFLQSQGDVVIVQDADLEYDPGEYMRLIKPIVEDVADVVIGSRFLGDRPHRVLYFWHYLGNRFLTTVSNLFTNLNLTDMETCYKVFRGDLIRRIAPTLSQKGFGIEPELTAKAARSRSRIYEISVSYFGRSYAEGKKIRWPDGIQALWCILRYAWRD